jgi:hypothetical protein
MTPVWNQLRDRPHTSYPPAGGRRLPPAPFFGVADANVTMPYATVLATEIRPPPNAQWRANLITNYTFGRRFPR